jgi:hypothetical protein
MPSQFERVVHSCLLFLVITSCVSAQENGVADKTFVRTDGADREFERRLDNLVRANPQRKGARPQIIRDCRALIHEYEGQPCSARVMLRIASLYRHHDLRNEWSPQPKQALKSYQRASETAEPGTNPWFSASFAVAQLLRDTQPEGIPKAREVLKLIAEYAPENSVPFVRLKSEFLAQCLREYDFTEAEVHCRELMSMSPDKVKVPELDLPVEKWQANAARELMLAFVGMRGDKPSRRMRILAFRDDFKHIVGIEAAAAESLQNLDEWVDPPPHAKGLRK